MRTTLILFLVLMTFGQIFAQKSFFIRPLIESKTSFGSNDWHKTSFKNSPYQGNAPFVWESRDIIWQNKLSPINLGLGFGYNFLNQKMSIEIDLSQDLTNSGYSLFFSKYDSVFGYGNGKLETNAGVAFTRLSLQATYQLFESKSKRFDILFFGGVSFGFNKKGDPLKNLVPVYSTAQIEPNTFLNVSSGLFTLNHNAFLWQFGLAVKVNGLRFGKQKTELFTFSIYYLHGKRPLSVTPVTVNVIENNSMVSTYNYNSYGNGSGINFQISRKLGFNFRKK